MNNTCEKHQICPIFNGILKDKQMTAKSYQNQYCNAGETGWNKCKRFLVVKQIGSCPPNLLPNSFKSVEQIITEMSNKEI
jgi:hypothetical protein